MIRLGLVLLIAAAATIVGWRLLDGQVNAADVEGPLHGVTYAPWAKDQDPIESKSSGVFSFLRTAVSDAPPEPVKPRKEQIERDFAMFGGKVNYVRTYRATDGGDVMPEARRAQRHQAGARRLDLQRQRGQAAVRPRGERGQRRGDPGADPHGQPEPQHRARAGRQREHPALGRPEEPARSQRHQPGPAHPRDPQRQAQRQGAGQHRRALARLAGVSRARARGRLSRRPHPALLGREVGRDAARIPQEPHRQAQGGRVPPQQEHHRHRGRLAVERCVAPQPRLGRGEVRHARRAGQERARHGGVAEVAEHRLLRRRGRRPAVEGRTTSKARRAATGACGTPTASPSSPGPARSSASRCGGRLRPGRWRCRCR